MNRDRYDLALTTVSDSAAAFYRDGVDRILSAWYGAGDAFDRAIAEDPAFALAHVARARVHQLNMESTEARTRAAQARQLAAAATRRERQHVEIMAAAIEGQPRAALSGAEQHLNEFNARGVRLAAISVDPPETNREHCRKQGYTYTFLSDPKAEVIRRYNLLHPRGGPGRRTRYLSFHTLRVWMRSSCASSATSSRSPRS